ncbi:uncharacterized protein ACNLHF_009473 isoform 1-T1 [Anomaloglossus baeobatrachus]
MVPHQWAPYARGEGASSPLGLQNSLLQMRAGVISGGYQSISRSRAGTPATAIAGGAGSQRGRASSSSSSDEQRARRRSRRRTSSRRHGRSRSRRRSRRSRSSRWRSPSSSDESPERSRRRRRTPTATSVQRGDVGPTSVDQFQDTGNTMFSAQEISGAASISGGSRFGVPSRDVGCPAQLLPMIHSSVAPSTWRAYGKAWSDWCESVGEISDTPSGDTLLQLTLKYLVSLHNRRASGAVTRNRLSGIAFNFKLRNWPDVTKSFLVHQVLKGWRRSDIRIDCRRPISFRLLADLINGAKVLCTSPYESTLFAAAFGTAFFGALRVGELVPKARGDISGLRRDDIVVCGDGLRVRLRKSKTDQESRGTWFPLFSISGPVSPGVLASSFIAIRTDGPHFFTHEDGSPLLAGQFLNFLRRILRHLGLPAAEFGTHSFRIGAATEASRAGMQDSDIQRVGRWRSRCFMRYIRPELVLSAGTA